MYFVCKNYFVPARVQRNLEIRASENWLSDPAKECSILNLDIQIQSETGFGFAHHCSATHLDRSRQIRPGQFSHSLLIMAESCPQLSLTAITVTSLSTGWTMVLETHLLMHSSPKETQVFGSCISFAKECMSKNLGSYQSDMTLGQGQ